MNRDDQIEKPGKSVYNPTVPAVDQALKILMFLAHNQKFKVRLSEICEKIGIHNSKGYTILNTLRQYEIVEKDPDTKAYSLGSGLLFLARHVLDNLSIPGLVAPFLESLSMQTNSSAYFGLIKGNNFLYIAEQRVRNAIGVDLRLGHMNDITHGAHGKAIVAFLSEEKREEILSREWLCFYGDGVKFSMKRLKRELAESRLKGYAADPGETNPGIKAVSAPVFRTGEDLIGAVILIGTYPAEKIGEFGNMVAATSKQISKKLGADVAKAYGM
ncbi:MAG: IclR family transcriptional regulator [Deltaproteobacteria bacterium]|nr:IclR family transcriptional regulator [Deltaproteobacteria bacterium]